MNKVSPMERRWLSCLLVLCMLLLSGCHATGPVVPEATFVPGTSPVLPEAVDHTEERRVSEATLWFRFGAEPLLAAESRALTRQPSQSYEFALITELLAGPGTRSPELHAVFPEGSRVLSTVRQGRVLFVTLSPEAVQSFPDEPVDWQEDDQWRVEAPLRRRLAMQALVATVTENCDVDGVQVLVAESGTVNGSLRLRQNYFLDDSEPSVLTGVLHRDENALLTPSVTMQRVLECWRKKDWRRLYLYLAPYDPSSGMDKPVYYDFVTAMESYPAIHDFQVSGGSLSRENTQTTFTVDATIILSGGKTESYQGAVMRLTRDGSLWKITRTQLTNWLES